MPGASETHCSARVQRGRGYAWSAREDTICTGDTFAHPVVRVPWRSAWARMSGSRPPPTNSSRIYQHGPRRGSPRESAHHIARHRSTRAQSYLVAMFPRRTAGTFRSIYVPTNERAKSNNGEAGFSPALARTADLNVQDLREFRTQVIHPPKTRTVETSTERLSLCLGRIGSPAR